MFAEKAIEHSPLSAAHLSLFLCLQACCLRIHCTVNTTDHLVYTDSATMAAPTPQYIELTVNAKLERMWGHDHGLH